MTTTFTPTRTAPAKGQRRRLDIHADFELRSLADGKIGIRGYASVFNQVAYGEVVRPGAFDKTLAERDDVRFLVNHTGVPIARTKAETLTLSLDDKGLIAEAPELDPANPTVAELASAMGRGDIDQMSFAFSPIRYQINQEPDPNETDEDYLWELLECQLWDVSVVTYPWYDETSAELTEFDRALNDLRAGRSLTPQRRQLVEDVLEHRAEAPTIAEPNPVPSPRRLDRAKALYDAVV